MLLGENVLLDSWTAWWRRIMLGHRSIGLTSPYLFFPCRRRQKARATMAAALAPLLLSHRHGLLCSRSHRWVWIVMAALSLNFCVACAGKRELDVQPWSGAFPIVVWPCHHGPDAPRPPPPPSTSLQVLLLYSSDNLSPLWLSGRWRKNMIWGAEVFAWSLSCGGSKIIKDFAYLCSVFPKDTPLGDC